MFNGLVPESMRRYDINEKSTLQGYTLLLSQIRTSVPDKIDKIQSILFSTNINDNEKLLAMKDILSGNPEVYEKIK